MPKGSDKSWVEKLYDKCKTWDHFQKPRLSQTAFLVKHFADQVRQSWWPQDSRLILFISQVEYECDGFLHKNKDTVMEEQVLVLKSSKNKLLSDLFVAEGKILNYPLLEERIQWWWWIILCYFCIISWIICINDILLFLCCIIGTYKGTTFIINFPIS